MGSYNTAVITTVGQALLTSVLGAQGTMTFTKLQTSSYAYASGTDLSALTSLNNVEQEANVGSATIVDSTHIAADATISNSGISTEYNANTLGIFASDGVNEVLFAVSTAVTPDVIPVDSGGTPSTYKYNFTLAVSSTSDITISAVGNIDASDVAYDNTVSGLSASNVQAAIDEIVSSVKRTGKITPSAVSVELTNETPTATVSFTTNSDGVASVASSDPTIATASLSGTVVTITGVKGGKITVTISIPETEHYTACSATISVDSNILVIGETYFFGGFYWTAAEDLGDNAVCLQSQGMTAGTWPAYKLTTDYTGTKNYGSANTAYNSNIDGDNIANYDDVTSTWYSKYSAVEKTGASYGSGLFLVSNAKCGTTTAGQAGSGNYYDPLKELAINAQTWGAGDRASWLGTVGTSPNAWYVGQSQVNKDYGQSNSFAVAPAFNLDLTKVKLVGDHIMLPTEEMPTQVSFASATPAQREAIVRAYEAGIIDITEYWSDGEEATATLPAIAASGTGWSVGESQPEQQVTLVLSLDNCKELVNIEDNGQKKTKFLYHQKNALEENGYMNSTNTNTGSWEGCARRGWCNNGYKAAMIQAFGDIFHELKNITAQTYNGTTNQISNDYFALPAGAEAFKGDPTYGQGGGTAGEQTTAYSNLTEFNALTRFKYYETVSNRVKTLGSGGAAWSERSPYFNSGGVFCTVNHMGYANYYEATHTLGIAPFGGV